MLTNEDKKQILISILDTIEGISDKEYQERVWIQGKGPEVDDFDEMTCHFLHEGGAVLEEYKEFNITEFQYHQLKKLLDEYKTFSKENNWPSEFIDTPEWTRITEMAKDVLKAFRYKQTSIVF